MKDFYSIREGQNKRETVLNTIAPICEAFGITDYDYIIDHSEGIERLVVQGQVIGCMCNSVGATVMELINYIWIETVAEEKYFPFHKQCLNALKKYWK